MLFEIFIQAVAEMFDCSTTTAGLVMGLLLTIIIFLLIAIATKGKGFEMTGLVSTLFATILFTVMGWYPPWTGAVLAFGLAIMTAWYVSKMGGK